MISQILDISLRTGIVYVIILGGLRLLGRRHLSQLSMLDFVLILLLSNSVQNAMVGNDSSLTGGIIAACTLLALNYLFSFFSFRSRRVGAVFEAAPTLLIHDGKVNEENLRHEKISPEELLRALREHSIGGPEDVKVALLEADGMISVVPRGEHVRHITSFRTRNSRIQMKKPI
jgi:uncharacterized membrane protein YcaP (DUF421 family)